jgi:hypothetical protein
MMKIFNALLFVWITSMILLRAPSPIAAASMTATVVTVVPFSIWLVASINPSGWGITGVGALWALLIAVRSLWRTTERRRVLLRSQIGLLSALAVSIVMSAQARLDVLLFAVVVVATVVVTEELVPKLAGLSTFQRRMALGLGAPAIVGALFALGIGAMMGTFGFAFRSDAKALSPDGPTVSVWLSNWLTHFPAVFLDAYGAAGLGENDVRIPQLVIIGSLLVVGGVLAFASQRVSVKQLSSAALFAFAFVAILWFASRELDLYNVPGRYVMPLFPVIIGMYVYYSRSEVQLFDIPRLRYIAIGLLGVANALGLYAVVERYAAGSSAGLRVIPVRFDEWWWDFLPVGPNGVVVLGSVSWVTFLVYAFRFLDERRASEVRP